MNYPNMTTPLINFPHISCNPKFPKWNGLIESLEIFVLFVLVWTNLTG